MSSFGAMARAAEYAAATNAKQRQVSREADEQKLPPKPVPISLSALASRPQQASRNKGTKIYKPFTPDILDDANTPDKQESPTHDGHDSPPPCPPGPPYHAPPPPFHYAPVRVFDPTLPMPLNMPPVIMPGRFPGFHPSPHMVFPESGSPFHRFDFPSGGSPLPQPPGDFYAAPFPVPGPGFQRVPGQILLPHNTPLHAPPSNFPRPGVPYSVPTEEHDQIATPFRRHPVQVTSNWLHPEDLSPTKQEEKFARLRSLSTSQSSQHQTLWQNSSGTDDIYNEGSPRADYDGNALRGLDLRSAAAESLFKLSKTDRIHTRMKAADKMTRLGDPKIVHKPAEVDDVTNFRPYDSTTLNKSTLVAVFGDTETNETSPGAKAKRPQEKTSKAEQKYLKGSPSPWGVVAPTDAQRQVITKLKGVENINLAQREVLAKAIANPAPGLSLPDFKYVEHAAELEVPGEHLGGDHRDVGSSSWCKATAPARFERERMQNLMRRYAREESQLPNGPELVAEDHDGQLAKMEAGASDMSDRADSRLETYIKSLAKKPSKDTLETSAESQSIQTSEETDNSSVANQVLGAVILNLHPYLDPNKPHRNKNDLVKFKPIPEYAIERGGGVIGAPRHTQSYFDDTRDNLHQAPLRIARDPRFRPPLPETKGPMKDIWRTGRQN